jgi:hypothetical protein
VDSVEGYDTSNQSPAARAARQHYLCAVLLSNLSADLVLEVLIEDKIRAYFPKEETSKSLVYLAGDATCRARP